MYSVPNISIEPDAMAILKNYNWDHDMVELRGAVDWIFSQVVSKLDKSMVVYKSDLPPNMINSSLTSNVNDANCANSSQLANKQVMQYNSIFDLGIREAKEQFEREYYTSQLKKYAGNIQRTSEIIGMDRSALYRRLKYLKIK
jgi:two-component system nitrogen regulation response regulator NtrX